ncbi:MAG: DUF998 domain-containing protein [Conexivisphaera sp.]|jgi:hypothetical membrane protein
MRALWASGPCAVAAAWITIALSAARNPWFSVTRNAFSDLGGPRAADPWIYNAGMIATAALLIAFSVYLLWSSGNRVESMGASFAVVGGIFLAMIGIFHEGTYPHVFVSTWFFAQMDMAIALWGAGSMISRRMDVGTLSLALAVGAPIGAMLVRWPSTALLEAYGIAVIDIWALAVALKLRPRCRVKVKRPMVERRYIWR